MRCTATLPGDGPLTGRLQEVGASIVRIDYPWWCDTTVPAGEDIEARLNCGLDDVLRAVTTKLVKTAPDVVLTNTMVIPWGAIAASVLGKPHVWYIREFGELDHELRFFLPLERVLRIILDSSNLVLTNSRAVARTLFGESPGSRILAVYNSIQIPADALIEEIEDYFARPNSIKLIITGGIARAKGQEDAIRATKELVKRGRDVELIIMGTGAPSYLTTLVNLVKDERLGDYVKFLEFRENPYPVVNQADIVLVCSRAEAFGRVTVEAMLLKKPVIASDGGAAPELIKDGHNGLLYRHGDYEQLADRIEYLIYDRPKMNELGENGYEIAQESFTGAAYGERVYQLLKGLEAKDNPLSSDYLSFMTNRVSTLIGRLHEEREGLRLERDQAVQGLASQRHAHEPSLVLWELLAARESELARIKKSVGWRLLSRYGVFKHRYLLPVYRLLHGAHRRDSSTATALETITKGIADEQESCLGVPTAYDVICFPIIDWEFRFQRPQHLPWQFARDGHRIFYLRTTFAAHSRGIHIDPITDSITGVQLSGPPHFDIHREEMDSRLASELLEGLGQLRSLAGITDAVCLVQLPFWAPLALAASERWGWKVVYDCMDEHSGFSTNSHAMVRHEGTLIAESDLVIASSHRLYQKIEGKSRRALLIQNAADFEHFNRPSSMVPLSHLGRPIIGYFGAISEWFDVEMVRRAAIARPDWQFVLIGDTFGAKVEDLRRLNNVHLLGEQPYAVLPLYLHRFDVACIPFLVNSLTEAINPVKFYEYLSAGKPVVAVDLPELMEYRDYFYPVTSRDTFIDAIESALTDDSSERAQSRVDFARRNTWAQRYGQLRAAVETIWGKVSIVIVSFVNQDYLKLCLDSIWTKTFYPNYEVIVVDNGGKPEILEYLNEAAAAERRLKLIFNSDNLGFARANNIGIRASSDSEYVVLLNDDTVVTRGWLGQLVHHLRDKRVGIVGPVTNWAGNEARVEVNYQHIDQLDSFALDYTGLRNGQVFEIPVLAMFCVAMRRSLLDEIGLLDERFEVGMFEDDDFALRVRKAGFRVICAEDVFIHHWGRASFRQLDQVGYERIFDKNRKRFEEKWGEPWQPHRHRER